MAEKQEKSAKWQKYLKGYKICDGLQKWHQSSEFLSNNSNSNTNNVQGEEKKDTNNKFSE